MTPLLGHQILLVFSFCCFAFGAWSGSEPNWHRVVSVGLAALVLSMLV